MTVRKFPGKKGAFVMWGLRGSILQVPGWCFEFQVGGCQNYGPFLGLIYSTAPITYY